MRIYAYGTEWPIILCRSLRVNPDPILDPHSVWFTDHARMQFAERYERKFCGFTVEEMFSWTVEDGSMRPEEEMLRLARHGDKVRYFAFEKWRFVVLETGGIFLVLTFEQKNFPWKKELRKKRRRPRSKKRR